MRIISLLIFTLLLLPATVFAGQDSVNDLAAQGSEAFAREDFDTAYELYAKALALEPTKAALLYNQANVLYRQKKYEEALVLYDKAIKTGPSQRLLSSIYFNAGNTVLELAALQTAEKQGVDELRGALAQYEKSFEMYRNSLEHARTASIAEGQSVRDAGLYARQNWAIARELWTQTWDKIRELERKNLKIEDGVAGLLRAQLDFRPNLEKVYLNSLSDDILKFNLKRLAEYQLDYHEDITTLTEMAGKEEEKLLAERENLKAASKAAAGQTAAGQPAPGQELAEIEAQLKTAGEIKKAVQQAAALDEWIVDGLKRGIPMQAWKNTRQMIDLLQSLTSFLKKSDPGLEAYQGLIVELGETENLLAQAAVLTQIKDQEGAVAAGQKRVTLAHAKIDAATRTIAKINLLLEQLKTSQQESVDQETDQADSSPKQDAATAPEDSDTTAAAPDKPSSSGDLLKGAAEELILVGIDELLDNNAALAKGLKEADAAALKEDKAGSVSDQLSQAGKALLWYQHLTIPVTQLLANLIQETENSGDQLQAFIDASDQAAEDTGEADLLVASSPDGEEVNILLFQLENVQRIIREELESSTGQKVSAKTEGQALISRLEKGLTNLRTIWQTFRASRHSTATKAEKTALLTGVDDLRLALVKNLLIFSPDTAIALYYERAKGLHKGLAELLPARPDNQEALEKHYANIAREAAALNTLLGQYFSGLQEAIAKLDNQDKKEAFSRSMEQRRQSVPYMQRFIDEGRDATRLLQEKKFQQAELLFKDMAGSLDKSRIAFMEQPKESQEFLALAIELQKKLEEQSRSANEAAAIEGDPGRIVPYVADNQVDINNITGKGIAAIEQNIGMAEVPVQGQTDPSQAAPGQQVETAKLKEAIAKASEAQNEMGKVEAFIKASEFHNTLTKHQEIINLLQEALDLLNNKPEDQDNKKGKDKQENKQQGDQQNNENQQKQPGDQGQNGDQQNSARPKKPLELAPQEARELLQQLNRQDEKQRGEKAEVRGRNSFNTPRPW